MYIACAVHACGVCALGELALVIDYDTLMHVLMSVPIPPAQGRVGIWRGLAIHSCQYPCTGAHLSSYYWGESKRAPHQWTQSRFFCLYIYICMYTCIYICHTSFRIYLSSISTICEFEQSMHMCYVLCYIETLGRESYGDTRTKSGKATCIAITFYA